MGCHSLCHGNLEGGAKHIIIIIIVVLEGLGFLGWSLQPHQIFWPRPIPTSKKIYTEGYVDVGPISLKSVLGRTLGKYQASVKFTSSCIMKGYFNV